RTATTLTPIKSFRHWVLPILLLLSRKALPSAAQILVPPLTTPMGENRNWYRLSLPSPLLLSRSLFTSRCSSSL
ncbi:sulfate transporter family protein, partial [Vibrio parahaemolyticus V-223/04]